MIESYKNKTRDELLSICKSKFANGRTYAELEYFLNLHEIDTDTQKYIFDELVKYEQELKDNPDLNPNSKPARKKPLPTNHNNLVIGIALIALGLIVAQIGNMRGMFYMAAVIISSTGIIFILVEGIKEIINLRRKG